MKTRGQLKSIDISYKTRRPIATFEVTATPEEIEKYQGKDLDIEFKKHREHRSLDANAMLWACLGEIAEAINTDNWSVYLYMLQRYGKYTYILIAPEAVEAMKAQWRETKIVGEQTVYENGNPKTMIQMLCFFGSSTYNSKEFSRLLDGVISDMKEMGLEVPPDEHTRALIEEMKRKEWLHGNH